MRSAILIAYLVFLALGSHAQSISAKVSKGTVALGDHFQISFAIEGDGTSFAPPSFDDFAVLSGPNKSSSMQWVNGNFSSSVSYSYILRPKAAGRFTIEPARMKAKGQTFESNPVTIEVVNGRQHAHSKTPNQPNKPANQSGGGNDQDVSTDLFLKLFVDKKDAYVGEQIVATYKLYMNTQVVNYSADRPVYNGFYAQELEVDPSKDMTQEVINGQKFTIATMKKVVLTPQKSGELEIPPLNLKLVIRIQDSRRSRNLFDQFFGSYRNVKVEVNSNPETVGIKALPTADQPNDFIGAVGDFQLKLTTDRSEVSVNDAVNLTLRLEGSGNIGLVGEPKVNFPTDFEVYDPKTKQDIALSGSGTRGSKTFEYVLIPRYSGDYELKPITMSYFDPKEKKYKRTSTQPIKLNIQKSNASGDDRNTAFVAPKKEDVQILGQDVRFIKTNEPDLRRREDRFYGSTLFYILSTLPFAGMGAALFLFSFFKAQYADVNALKSKRAGGIAKKHLAKARKLIKGEDTAFYEAISAALFGYISDKMSIPRSELNRERIELELKERHIDPQLLEDLRKALDECEMVRFAPGVVRSKEDMLAASADIIESLEHEA